MTDTSTAQGLTLERTFKATVDELWSLWTTKEGFESWWGPEGFRVDVHALEARVGGKLQYDMIADTAEAIAAMQAAGEPLSHDTQGTFTELVPMSRLAITHVINFFEGVEPYENTMVVEFQPDGEYVRMVVILEAMHDPMFTNMQREGFGSQLTKLDKRFEQKS